ncbi:MAG TPA: Hsp70 family protein [Ktedonobacteraceae bacterium]|nr:Hsp70 family protein [Ktedonobacteraceae bacterium]
MSHAIGIDLGTTNSAMAIAGDQGHAMIIPNAEGMATTPSVAIWHKGGFLVGQPALDLVYHAEGAEQLEKHLIRGVKRLIGKIPRGGLSSNGHATDPVEVSSAILHKLASDASMYLGYPIRNIVITVPAHFVDYEREATRKAAEMAGLRVLQIVNEPSAAALAYTSGQTGGKAETALVFDLGGGTFDVTVLQLEMQQARVLSTKGIEELGGMNFTTSLVRFLKREYEKAIQTPFPDDGASSFLIFSVAEGAKRRLSEAETTEVYLAPKTGKVARIPITRQIFTRQIGAALVSLEVAVQEALNGARKAPADINRVLLCGGSSRIPAVQKMLTELFGRPPEASLDLDLSVAFGAAYLATTYHEPGLQQLVDCVSYSVGIALKDARGADMKSILLHPGDPLDVWSKPPLPVKILTSAAAFPPIRVYTGDSEEIEEKDYLGSIACQLPSDTQPGTVATVEMRQNRNGQIEININVGGKSLPCGLQRL